MLDRLDSPETIIRMLDRQDLRRLATVALAEDIGRRDITTDTTVPPGALAHGTFVLKQDAVVCGMRVVRMVFEVTDPRLRLVVRLEDGRLGRSGTVVASVTGRARSILRAERVALNFLQRLSGVATLTREFVRRVRGTRAKILDTRKTTPGLRALEKYAVRIGGGTNHRLRLDEAALIKDNHLPFARDLTRSISHLRGRTRWIEIEAASMDDVRRFVPLDINAIMLDNFPLPRLRRAVRWIRSVRPHLIIEASGGVTLKTVRAIAQAGVDWISSGSLTHSAPAVDLSLELGPHRDGR